MNFEKNSYLAQVNQMRLLAMKALTKYPINFKNITLIKHSANTNFKIEDDKNNRYLLRIHAAHFHSLDAIGEEIMWLTHIRNTGNIVVPEAVGTIDGDYIVKIDHPKVCQPRFCVIFKWISGKNRWKSINKSYAENLGSLIARLQVNGQAVRIQHRNYWSVDGLVGTDKSRFFNIDKLSDVSKQQQHEISLARKNAYQVLKAYEKSNKDKLGLMHCDMQPDNILYDKGRYSVIDFDECGIGLYGHDLANALCAFEYLVEMDRSKSYLELQDALFNGYSKYMPLTQEDILLSPYFLLARKLASVGWIELRKTNPKLKPYFHGAVKRAIDYNHRVSDAI